MPEGYDTIRYEVGLGPGHIVLDGDPALPFKGAQLPPPNFWPMSIVAKRSPISATVEHLCVIECFCNGSAVVFILIPGSCCLFQMGQIQVWTRPIEPEGSWAFVLFNSEGPLPSLVAVKLSDLGMEHPAGYSVMEVFDGSHFGNKKPSDVLKVSVNPTGAFFGKATVLQ